MAIYRSSHVLQVQHLRQEAITQNSYEFKLKKRMAPLKDIDGMASHKENGVFYKTPKEIVRCNLVPIQKEQFFLIQKWLNSLFYCQHVISKQNKNENSLIC